MSLLTDLVAHWKLNETSGTRADSHGSNDLTDNNTVGSASGKLGNAADFESTNNEYLSHADNADLATGDFDWTVTAWFRLESLPSAVGDTGGIVTKHKDGDEKEFIVAVSTGEDKPLIRLFALGGSTIATATWGAAVSTGTWYFVEAYHDAANNEIGIAINNGTHVTAPTGGTASARKTDVLWQIGSLGNGSSFLDGRVDSVSRWDRLLTSQERSDLYNSGDGLDYDDFGGADTTLTDAGPAAVDVTVSAPTVQHDLVLAIGPVAIDVDAVAPTISLGRDVAVGSAAINVAAVTPTPSLGAIAVAAGPAAVDVLPIAPTVDLALALAAGPAAVSVAANAPTPSLALGVAAGPAAVDVAAVAPAIGLGNLNVAAGTAAVDVTPQAPTVSQGVSVATSPAVVEVTPLAPSVSLALDVTVGTATIDVASLAPTLDQGATLAIGSAVVDIASVAPAVDLGTLTVTTGTAAIDVDAVAPTVGNTTDVSVGTTAIDVAAMSPTLDLATTLAVAPAGLEVAAAAPAVATATVATLTPAVMSVSASGPAEIVYAFDVGLPPALLTLGAAAPAVDLVAIILQPDETTRLPGRRTSASLWGRVLVAPLIARRTVSELEDR
ncbi:MAG: LamG-like jellyroll fold domain-containing protein [Actinomycetota bacterium]